MSILITLVALSLQPPNLEASREPGLTYEPFSGQAADARLRLAADSLPEGTLLVAEPSAGAPLVFALPGGTTLPYRLTADTVGPGSTEDRLVVPLTADADGRAETVVRLLVDPGPVVPPGSYDALLDLRLTEADGTVLSELLAVPTSVEVSARAQVVLAGTSGAFDPQASVGFVDFGTLESGETRRLFVAVRANSDAVVTVTSENGGVMTLRGDEAATQPDAAGVAYSVDLDGEVSDLAVPLQVIKAPPLNAAGAAYPFTITVGDVGGLFAGTYRDDITIEVRPQ